MAGTVSVDALLADAVSKMDALNKRMDALEVGEKNIIKGDDDDDDKKSDGAGAKARGDDDDDDDGSKKDGITAPKTRIKDDDGDKKKDDASVAAAKVTGDTKKADTKKADAKKADAKKADDGELEIKHGKEKGDSSKKADDDDDKKSDDDDDDKKSDDFPPKKGEKDDSARADEIVSLRQQIERLSAMMKPRSDDEHAAFADAQARADAVFNGFGTRAPRPLEGEVLLDYRKRLATKLKTHSIAWKGVKLSQLPEEAFGIAESQIYADADTAAANPVDLGEGELRTVTKIDPSTGVRSNVFYGKESFVKAMGRPGRRVSSFRTLQSV
jgi:hypothetical protein